MRYIYLQPVKTTQDKKKAKKLPAMAQGELAKLISDKNNTRVIIESDQKESLNSYLVFMKLIFKEVSDILLSKNHFLSGIIKEDYKEQNSPPLSNDAKENYKLINMSSIATDLFYIKKIREDDSNNVKLYKDLYKEIRAVIKTAPGTIQKQFSTFPSSLPSGNPKLPDMIKKLAGLALKTFPRSVSIPSTDHYDPTCPGPEVGEGNKTDQFMDQNCSGSNPTSNRRGFLKNLWWPLKPHMTSVKNQGNRGTCPAFGIVAATESRISLQYNIMVNLSEQDLYKKQKLDWNPIIFDDYYGDGYFPPISVLYQMGSAYTFPFESAWQYNPSMSRIEDPPILRKYSHSCDGYNGICSDTNHQSHRVEQTIDVKKAVAEVNTTCKWIFSFFGLTKIGDWVCQTVTNWVEKVVDQLIVVSYDTDIPGNSNYWITNFALIWDPLYNADFNLVKSALIQSKPVIFSFIVPGSFNTSNHSAICGKGFVVYSATEALPLNEVPGGHVVELVGYMDNNDLPEYLGITPGSGGGYFIIKNSWGKCFGDMGYAYLPYDWVNKWGTSMVAVNSVSQQNS